MVVRVYNPSTSEAEDVEDVMFEISLDFIARP
jgi:hypothetical protein